MGNCLKTQLKEIVNNDNLELLGYAKILVNELPSGFNQNKSAISIKNSNAFVVKVVGDGWLSTTYAGLDNPSTRYKELTLLGSNAYNEFYHSNGNLTILISEKYTLTYINSPEDCNNKTIIINDYSYSTLTSLRTYSIQGTLSESEALLETLTSIWCRQFGVSCDTALLNGVNVLKLYTSRNVSGNLSNIATENLTELIMWNSKVSGNVVNDLGSCIEMTYIDTLYNSNITGSTLEDLAQAQIDAGRISGTLTVRGRYTYNNININEDTYRITFDSGSYTITKL